MNRLYTATLFLLMVEAQAFVGGAAPSPAASDHPTSNVRAGSTAAARTAYDVLPLSFEINQGQTDARVKFIARGPGHTVFLTPTGAVLSLQGAPATGSRGPRPMTEGGRAGLVRALLHMTLVGARPDAPIGGIEELPGRVNYLLGTDARRWRLGIPTYGRVKHRGVYPGVDLVYYGNQGELEYDFIVQPGADPSVIRLGFEGASLRLDPTGDLVAVIPGGEVRLRKPLLYQDIDGRRLDVMGSWRLAGPHEAAFTVSEYDDSHVLVIDPVVSYSTYLGARDNDDNAVSIAVDGRGYAYITGSTTSANFPTTADAMQPDSAGGPGDAFLTKLNRTGTALVYSTYFGGSGSDAASDIAVDNRGYIYIAGATQSSDFPTANAMQAFAGEIDAFVTKFNRSGTALVYSTFLGGSGIDSAYGLAVAPSGVVYLAGGTESADFPTTPGAFQPAYAGSFDAFVASINRAGSALRYATYVGGATGAETATDIDIDALGQAHIVGSTRGTDFPTTPGALQTTADGLSDQAFVAKLNPRGTALRYGTYFGGADGNEGGFAIAVNRQGLAYVGGHTSSNNLPTTENAFQPTRPGGDDGFLLKLNRTGSAIRYLTYIGGEGQDWVESIALDARGEIYLTGTTQSPNFPIKNAHQPTYGGNADAFVTRLTRSGSSAVYSTYVGGSRREDGMAIAVDPARSAYVTGFTASGNFPTTPGAFDSSYNGFRDSFVMKLDNARRVAPTTGK